MSEYTRSLLANAGISATEEDIKIIDASGHPYEVCMVLVHCNLGAWNAKNIVKTMEELMTKQLPPRHPKTGQFVKQAPQAKNNGGRKPVAPPTRQAPGKSEGMRKA